MNERRRNESRETQFGRESNIWDQRGKVFCRFESREIFLKTKVIRTVFSLHGKPPDEKDKL